jgi:hypothetical protein
VSRVNGKMDSRFHGNDRRDAASYETKGCHSNVSTCFLSYVARGLVPRSVSNAVRGADSSLRRKPGIMVFRVNGKMDSRFHGNDRRDAASYETKGCHSNVATCFLSYVAQGLVPRSVSNAVRGADSSLRRKPGIMVFEVNGKMDSRFHGNDRRDAASYETKGCHSNVATCFLSYVARGLVPRSVSNAVRGADSSLRRKPGILVFEVNGKMDSRFHGNDGGDIALGADIWFLFQHRRANHVLRSAGACPPLQFWRPSRRKMDSRLRGNDGYQSQ